MACYIPRWYTRPKTVTHPNTNRARRALTSFMRPTPPTTTTPCRGVRGTASVVYSDVHEALGQHEAAAAAAAGDGASTLRHTPAAPPRRRRLVARSSCLRRTAVAVHISSLVAADRRRQSAQPVGHVLQPLQPKIYGLICTVPCVHRGQYNISRLAASIATNSHVRVR